MSIRILFSAVLVLFALGTRPVQANPTPIPATEPAPVVVDGVTLNKDVRYGNEENGVRNLLDLYLPAGAGEKFPVIVALHGGGLSTGSKEMLKPKAFALAKRGYAVAVVNYRLKPTYHLPSQIYDVKAAIRWLRAHAATYKLDPVRIGVLGSSAGATLAAVVGTSGSLKALEGEVGNHPQESTQVQAVVALAGVYREFAWFVRNPDGSAASKELVTLCAPITHVSPNAPPFLLVIGDKDNTPQGIEDHTRFHQALKATGVDSTLLIVPGAEHGQCFDREFERIVTFLDKQLKG